MLSSNSFVVATEESKSANNPCKSASFNVLDTSDKFDVNAAVFSRIVPSICSFAVKFSLTFSEITFKDRLVSLKFLSVSLKLNNGMFFLVLPQATIAPKADDQMASVAVFKINIIFFSPRIPVIIIVEQSF